MKTPPPPSTTAHLGAFTTLKGGSPAELVAGGAHAPIVALHANSATWWPTGADPAAAVELPNLDGLAGARWTADGKLLRVGLGSLDVAVKTFAIEPALDAFARPGRSRPTLVGAAWLADATRVALLLGPPALLADRKPPATYDAAKRELAIASLAGGEPIRKPLDARGATAIAAGDDRILVTGATTQLFDAAGAPIAPPAPLPERVIRASYGAGVFVLVAADGTVTLVEPSTGAIATTWAAPGTLDAVAIAHGIVTVDGRGTVRVGCVAAGAVKPVAESSAGAAATRVQVVGDRIVVAADGPDPVRVATFANPCR